MLTGHRRVYGFLNPRRTGEEGNVIIALTIIMILVALGAALVAEVIGNENNVSTRQNTSTALASAEAGLSDALFRIDQGASSTFCVSTTISGCINAPIPAAPGVSYKATANGNTWTIDSLGTSQGIQAAVQQTLSRSPAYPFAVFGNTALNFNGNSGSGLGTYDSGTTTPPNTTAPVSIGSNGTISCNGGLGSNVTSYYYTGGGGISGSCGTPSAVSSRYNLSVPQAPASNQGCPNGGLLGSNNGVSTLPGGTYLCTAPVTIDGNLSESAAVSLYVILDLSQYGSNTGALTITAGSNVNYPGAGGANPDARQLQILTNSTGTVGNSNGQGYTFSGIIDGPDASLTANGCQSTYYGALVINTLTCNGGPHLAVYYENSLTQFYGVWTSGGFTQISPSSVTIP